MTGARNKKPCHLCEQGIGKHGRKHGFRLDGIGMVDTSCPVSKEEYEKAVAELRKFVDELRATS